MGILLAQSHIMQRGLVSLHKGDITQEEIDAIVNAANSHLAHGGGVAGAIVRRGGRVIQEESSRLVREHGPVPVGRAVWTGGGTLKVRGVIHAVGPQWGEGDEPAKLQRAAESAIAVALANDCRAIALPAISSGIFRFPKPRCAQVLVGVAVSHFERISTTILTEIRFTLIDDETVGVFSDEFIRRFGRDCLIKS